MNQKTLIRLIALTQVSGIGPVSARKLIAFAESIDAVFDKKTSELIHAPRMNIDLLNKIRSQENLQNAEKELQFIEKHKIKLYSIFNENYPYRLKQCIDAPLLYYSIGDVDFNAAKIVNIVGTRSKTEYGETICKNLIEGLAQHNVVIVSGLANGIDTVAHQAALANNLKTIAVLGNSLDVLYPQENRALAQKITKNGALVTEFSTCSHFDKTNFVRRNRIIAGLCDATIVIESATKGGALITAAHANSYNRDVFAVPGRISDKYSQGCNKLIKTNQAALVETIQDIEYIMNWGISEEKAIQKELFIETTEDENDLLQYFYHDKNTSLEYLTLKTGWKISKLLTILLNLEFKGIVKTLPGNEYRLAYTK